MTYIVRVRTSFAQMSNSHDTWSPKWRPGKEVMSDILSGISTRRTRQTERAKPEQVKNAAGGYVYQADDDVRLHRFLTIGTSGSTYYASAKDLTRENADVLFRAVDADPLKVVAQVVEISTAVVRHPGR